MTGGSSPSSVGVRRLGSTGRLYTNNSAELQACRGNTGIISPQAGIKYSGVQVELRRELRYQEDDDEDARNLMI